MARAWCRALVKHACPTGVLPSVVRGGRIARARGKYTVMEPASVSTAPSESTGAVLRRRSMPHGVHLAAAVLEQAIRGAEPCRVCAADRLPSPAAAAAAVDATGDTAPCAGTPVSRGCDGTSGASGASGAAPVRGMDIVVQNDDECARGYVASNEAQGNAHRDTTRPLLTTTIPGVTGDTSAPVGRGVVVGASEIIDRVSVLMDNARDAIDSVCDTHPVAVTCLLAVTGVAIGLLCVAAAVSMASGTRDSRSVFAAFGTTDYPDYETQTRVCADLLANASGCGMSRASAPGTSDAHTFYCVRDGEDIHALLAVTDVAPLASSTPVRVRESDDPCPGVQQSRVRHKRVRVHTRFAHPVVFGGSLSLCIQHLHEVANTGWHCDNGVHQ